MAVSRRVTECGSAHRATRTSGSVRESSCSSRHTLAATAPQMDARDSAISVHKASRSFLLTAITQHCKKNRIQVKHYLANFWRKAKKIQIRRNSRALGPLRAAPLIVCKSILRQIDQPLTRAARRLRLFPVASGSHKPGSARLDRRFGRLRGYPAEEELSAFRMWICVAAAFAAAAYPPQERVVRPAGHVFSCP
jgi:hypothetical protein